MKGTITPFGAAIRRERRKRNLSMRDVAEAAKVSTQYISQLETNRSKPSPVYVARIAHFFGVDSLRLLKLALPDEFMIWAAAFGYDRAQQPTGLAAERSQGGCRDD